MAETCTGLFDCAAVGHDEDTDCYSVTCSPPKCEQHGTAVITCRECAAEPPAGWQLVECAEGHPVMWMPDDQWGYPPPCMYCSYEALSEAHTGCTHARHGRWRSWRITFRVSMWMYALGITAGGGTSYGGGCRGCVTFRFTGSRPYILGWPDWKWSCLLRQRHWPGDFIGLSACAKCLPCPTCGSRTAGHEPGCADDLSSKVSVGARTDEGRARSGGPSEGGGPS